VIAFLTNVMSTSEGLWPLHPVGMTSFPMCFDTGLALQLKPRFRPWRHELDVWWSDSAYELAGAHKGHGDGGRCPCHPWRPNHLRLQGWLAWLAENPCATRNGWSGWRLVVGRGSRSAERWALLQHHPEVGSPHLPTLGLVPDTSATQVIGRDRHAGLRPDPGFWLATSLEGILHEIATCNAPTCWRWRKESFARARKESFGDLPPTSATHIRQPSGISGLARVLRSYTRGRPGERGPLALSGTSATARWSE